MTERRRLQASLSPPLLCLCCLNPRATRGVHLGESMLTEGRAPRYLAAVPPNGASTARAPATSSSQDSVGLAPPQPMHHQYSALDRPRFPSRLPTVWRPQRLGAPPTRLLSPLWNCLCRGGGDSKPGSLPPSTLDQHRSKRSESYPRTCWLQSQPVTTWCVGCYT